MAKHMVQSFKPGEVSPEEAHRIGRELCDKFLKGNYQYVIATHVDREHIHRVRSEDSRQQREICHRRCCQNFH